MCVFCNHDLVYASPLTLSSHTHWLTRLDCKKRGYRDSRTCSMAGGGALGDHDSALVCQRSEHYRRCGSDMPFMGCDCHWHSRRHESQGNKAYSPLRIFLLKHIKHWQLACDMVSVFVSALDLFHYASCFLSLDPFLHSSFILLSLNREYPHG